MELLLFKYNLFNLGVNLKQIKAVRKSDDQEDDLMSVDYMTDSKHSPLILELKNGQRLPADEIIEIADLSDPLENISPFLAGCFQTDLGSGFLIRNNSVFMILKDHFLSGGQDENDKKIH